VRLRAARRAIKARTNTKMRGQVKVRENA